MNGLLSDPLGLFPFPPAHFPLLLTFISCDRVSKGLPGVVRLQLREMAITLVCLWVLGGELLETA